MDLDALCAEMFPFSVRVMHKMPHPEIKERYAPVLTMSVPRWFLQEFQNENGTIEPNALWAYVTSKKLEQLTGETTGAEMFDGLVKDESARAGMVNDGEDVLLVVMGSYRRR